MSLPVLNARAAGLDVGSEKIHASIAGGPVEIFGTCTADLRALRDWLHQGRARTVALEATGVYWQGVYEVLEAAGMEVVVVNGAHVKNLPGRKSDMQDAPWISTLHMHGLLRGGYVPEAAIRRLRHYQRLRQDHITMGATHVQHMQKALDQMNVKFHDVISSLVGVSGLKVVRAIVAGERNREVLADLCDRQVLKRKREQLVRSLEGTWAPELVFALGHALAGWEFYQGQIAACDQQIALVLAELAGPPSAGPAAPAGPTKELRHNAPRSIERLNQTLRQIFGGTDLSLLPSLSDYTVLQVLAEVGPRLDAWPTVKHWTAWLGLAPGTRQSGKGRRKERRYGGRAGQIFRVAARSLARAKNSWLGAFYRRIAAVKGGRVANKAAARKVAELFYYALVKGMTYVEQGLKHYEETYTKRRQAALARQAKELGMIVLPLSLLQAAQPVEPQAI